MNNSLKEVLRVRNPRTGILDYEIVNPGHYELDQICKGLRQGFFRQHDPKGNNSALVLSDLKECMLQWKDRIIQALIHDTGRRRESFLEFDLVIQSLDHWHKYTAEMVKWPERKSSTLSFIELEQQRVPYTLVGVISPWNFPLLLAMIDTIPALCAGCSVVVKPSEVTPRFADVISSMINQSELVSERLAFVNGDGKAGSLLIEYVDLVCFTGSVPTGRKVYQKAVDQFIPCFLELGGKDSAIIMEDADLDHASSSILWGSTANAGQSCLSIERVYVQKSVYHKFVNILKEKAQALILNSEDLERGQIGPIISIRQAEILNEHLHDALEKGAEILTGWDQVCEIKGGLYLRPTVLIGVDHTMKVMKEETFGPIIPVMDFEEESNALRWANDSEYGLSGAVFSGDEEKALRLARRIQAGAISINDCALTAVIHEGEKNAFKLSGIGGSRMGISSIRRFFRNKVMMIKNNHNPSPWWYSNS
ncbi:MAG TPA: aldehyde dehydrogenase family protein [Saprospiraceae bacterium]|nr:aldehyde dehydrogenase family protein [Saprospiraceae bacterium]